MPRTSPTPCSIAALLVGLGVVALVAFNAIRGVQRLQPVEMRLTALDGREDDNFGWSVAIDDALIVAGADRAELDGPQVQNSAGAAYVFWGDAAQWSHMQKLVAKELQAHDKFGFSVAVDAHGWVFVGAEGDDGAESSDCENCGAVYVFERVAGEWVERQKLQASDAQAHDGFGESISVHGSTLVVGASRERGGPGDPIKRAGAAYVFRLDQGAWREQQKITSMYPSEEGHFAISVAVGDTFIAVGAPREAGGAKGEVANAGAVYLFAFDDDRWVVRQRLEAMDGRSLDGFGYSVDLDGTWLIVGASGEDGGPEASKPASGAAHVFRFANGQWDHYQKLQASDAQAKDNFGYSVGISESGRAVVGAYGEDGGPGNPHKSAGAAYVFELQGGQWLQTRKLGATPPHPWSHFGRSVALSDSAIVVGTPHGPGGVGGQQQGAGSAYTF